MRTRAIRLVSVPRASSALFVACAMAAAALLLAGPAGATTTTVYCPGGDLQSAIDGASQGDTIVIYGTCYGNFVVEGGVYGPYDLTLQGSSGATLNGRGTGPALSIVDANVTIANLTITNGRNDEGGGIDFSGYGATLTVTNSTVLGNRAGFGGGIYATGGTVVLTGVTVTRNTADSQGGGIDVYGVDLSMTASTVSRNSSNTTFDGGGGGIRMEFATALLTSTRVTANRSSDYGGGIADYGGCFGVGASPIGEGTACVTAGTAGGRAVAGRAQPVSTSTGLTLVNSSVDHNVAAEDGGGIYNISTTDDSPVTLQGTTVSFNTARDGDGGGVYNYGTNDATASLLAIGSTFQGNQAGNGDGGAVYNASAVSAFGTALTTIAQSNASTGATVVNANRAQRGAAFANEQMAGVASLTLQPGAKVTGNKASITGGGVWNACGSFSSLAQIFLNTPNNVVSGCS